jgi:sec-independent protein translocase protein TatC
VFSQTMLAVPMWVLFEVGLLACSGLKRPEQTKGIVTG